MKANETSRENLLNEQVFLLWKENQEMKEKISEWKDYLNYMSLIPYKQGNKFRLKKVIQEMEKYNP